MKIALESTTELIRDEGGVPLGRVWKGTTESGVPILAIIYAVSPQTHDIDINAAFASELIEIPTQEDKDFQ